MQTFSTTNVRNEIQELGCAFLGAFGLACSGIQIWEENQCACMHFWFLMTAWNFQQAYPFLMHILQKVETIKLDPKSNAPGTENAGRVLSHMVEVIADGVGGSMPTFEI